MNSIQRLDSKAPPSEGDGFRSPPMSQERSNTMMFRKKHVSLEVSGLHKRSIATNNDDPHSMTKFQGQQFGIVEIDEDEVNLEAPSQISRTQSYNRHLSIDK